MSIYRPRRRRAVQADWSRRLGAFALASSIVAILTHRSGVLDTNAFLITVTLTSVFALFSLIFGAWAIIRIWMAGDDGAKSAVFGFLWSALVLAVPIAAGVMIFAHPQTADIATDTADPPRFTTELAEETIGLASSSGYPADDAEDIRAAYPLLLPRRYELPPETVFDAALSIARSHDLVIRQSSAPSFESPGGRIEAAVTSLIFGFRGGIIIRVRESGDEATVDVRSATFGLDHGLGIDIRRIESFFAALEAALETPDRFAGPQDKL